MISSFSIHAGDCIKQKEVLGTVEQCLMESEKIKMTTQNPFIREQKSYANVIERKRCWNENS